MLTTTEQTAIENFLATELNKKRLEYHEQVQDELGSLLDASAGSSCTCFQQLNLPYDNTQTVIGNNCYENKQTGITIAFDRIIHGVKNRKTKRTTNTSNPTISSVDYLYEFYPASQKNNPQNFLYLLIVTYDPTTPQNPTVTVKILLLELIEPSLFKAPTTGRGQVQLSFNQTKPPTNSFGGSRGDWMKIFYTTLDNSYLDRLVIILQDIRKYRREQNLW